MALNSTMYKATLHISNMDRNYYHEHQLNIAKHPSETDERLMVRVLAFALYADEALEFGKGISAEDEPALWRKDLTGEIKLWIDVGLPDERRIRKACGRAKQVVVIMYGKRNAAELWWNEQREELADRKNLTVLQLPEEATRELAALAVRNMELSCTIEDGQISLMNDNSAVSLGLSHLINSN
jgi:uncharacterized protein YaeQ